MHIHSAPFSKMPVFALCCQANGNDEDQHAAHGLAWAQSLLSTTTHQATIAFFEMDHRPLRMNEGRPVNRIDSLE